MRGAHRLEREEALDRVPVARFELGAELREHARADTVRPVSRADEARARSDEAEATHLAWPIQRGAQGDQTAERPADPQRARRRRRDAARAVGDVETRFVAAATVSRQVDQMHVETFGECIQQPREDAAMAG